MKIVGAGMMKRMRKCTFVVKHIIRHSLYKLCAIYRWKMPPEDKAKKGPETAFDW